jgi:hypothetical protein
LDQVFINADGLADNLLAKGFTRCPGAALFNGFHGDGVAFDGNVPPTLLETEIA